MIEVDGTWQRYFLMVTAYVVVQEVSDLPAALLFPICLGASKTFQRDFWQLFGFWNRVEQPRTMGTDRNYRAAYDSVVCSPKSATKLYQNRGDTGETELLMLPNSSQRYISADTMNGRMYSDQPNVYATMTPTINIPRRNWDERLGDREYMTNHSDPILDASGMNAAQLQQPLVAQRYLTKRQRNISPANELQWCSNGTYHERQSVRPAKAPYRRAASANDLFYAPTNVNNHQQRIPTHGSCEAEWFEPRSYV